MPNYVKNVIRFDNTVPDSKLQEFLLRVTVPETPSAESLPAPDVNPNALAVTTFDNRHFDFNKVIPMPESLNIESGTRTDIGIALVKTIASMPKTCRQHIMSSPSWDRLFHERTREGINAEYKGFAKAVHPDKQSGLSEQDANEVMQRLNKMKQDADKTEDLAKYPVPDGSITETAIKMHSRLYEDRHILRDIQGFNINPNIPDAIDRYCKTPEGAKCLKIGTTALENIKNYGVPTWYDWCIEHWGTKWNAMGTDIDLPDRTMTFTTAWSSPDPIIKELVKQFPEIQFTYLYADEDTGANTGRYVYDGTELKYTEFENNSQAAYQTYMECWGKSDYLRKDENGLWKYHVSED